MFNARDFDFTKPACIIHAVVAEVGQSKYLVRKVRSLLEKEASPIVVIYRGDTQHSLFILM